MLVDVHNSMEDLPGLLAMDYGFRSQATSAPMSVSRGVAGANAAAGSASSSSSAASNRARSGWDSTASFDFLLGDHGAGLFSSRNPQDHGGGLRGFDDFYTNPSSNGRPATSSSPSSSSSFSYHDILEGFKDPATKSSSAAVYDKPVYDEDMFNGLPGVKSSSTAGEYEDVFAAISSPASNPAPPSYDDLLDNLGRTEPVSKGSDSKRAGGEPVVEDVSGLDDLIPGFGGSSRRQQRGISETDRPQLSVPSTKSTSSMDDPFVVLESLPTMAHSSSGLFTDPTEHINVQSGGMEFDDTSVRGGVSDNIDAFDGFPKSVPLFSSEMPNIQNDRSPRRNMSPGRPAATEEPAERSSVKNTFENNVPKTVPVDSYRESHETLLDMPTKSTETIKPVNRGGASTMDVKFPYETNSMEDMSPKSEEHFEMADDEWLTVSEIPLITQPTTAPPPLRPPPPLVIKQTSFANTDRESSYSFPQFSQSYEFSKPINDSLKTYGVSPIDELEEFAMAKPQANAGKSAEILLSEEEIKTNSTAAASMKESMDRAEANLDSRSAKNGESTPQGRDEKDVPDAYGREHKEEVERLDREREQRESDEKEKEQKRLEKEREQELERIREREKAREAVERATREARERAAAEARRKAERAAVEKVAAGARERAGRAAVQRVAAEARDKAAAEARERLEREITERERVDRAAAEARERAAVASRERAAAERAAVERATAEARRRAERVAVDQANAEARERASAAAREKQQKNEAVSAPRPTTMDPAFDTQVQNKGGSDGGRRTSAASTTSISKASFTTNIVDDLSSIFGAAPSSDEFQEIEGESEERQRASLERHQRMHERAAKALAEKNERDMQTQRDQAERHRISETLDIEIKRWAAGKEGNLRALLSTLQYVLWPECGWQPVSLTDLIISASVKKVYRKATLCIHPDKVQQKGANLQQKYIAEKVFDLLKEAWNKFNSEELF